jgi:hypothetical protein
MLLKEDYFIVEAMNDLPNPTCGDCQAFYKPGTDVNGVVRGSCLRRTELTGIPQDMKYCYLFAVKESSVGLVKVVDTKPVKSQRSSRRSTASSSSEPFVNCATLEEPVSGDTEGEITMDRDGLKQVLRELLEEETMYGFPTMGAKWQGGSIVMKPGDEQLQEKELSIDAFFHKIVMVRDRLRVMEAKINSNKEMGEGDKVELQSYISKCYGSLTSFNVLFQDKENSFSSK